MAFSSLKLNPVPASMPRVGIRNRSLLKPQASFRFERSTPKVSLYGGSISRRDALSCVTSTLLLTSLIQAEPANARIAKPEIRRKIMEKLQQLREKAGLKKKENTGPKEEKRLPKLLNKDGSKMPKVEKMLPKLENKDGDKSPKEEKTLPKSENKDEEKLPKEQTKLVEASF